MHTKRAPGDLALFGGSPLFDQVRSTSNLVAPDTGRFLQYSAQFLQARSYANGPLTQLLESRLAEFHQTRHCIAFCSGFWALVLAIRCLALPGRREVVMPSLTYRRMADVVAWLKLTPHFCEVEPDTLAISARTAEPCINDDTALLLAVHPIINCCDAGGMEALASQHALPLLIDAVESVYESWQGRKTGSFGNAECYSMHASKLVNGYECGYLTTNDLQLAQRLRQLREGGRDDTGAWGINARLPEAHAAAALAGLDDLDAQVARNRARYRAYQQAMQAVPGMMLLPFDESERCAYKNIVVRLLPEWPLSRADTLEILHAEKVLARPYYAPPLHRKKTAYPTIAGDLPLTDRLSEQFMLLPCGHFVSEDDITSLAQLLRTLATHGEQIRRRLGR